MADDNDEPFAIDADPAYRDWLRGMHWPWPEIHDVTTTRAYITNVIHITVEDFKELQVYLGNLKREPWLKDL